MPEDLEELGRLVEQHYGAVVAVAYATTRDLALSEDIAQETFIAAWGSRDRLRDPSRVRPWLCGIARNQGRNALRARRREVGGDVIEAVDAVPNVIEGAVEREAQAELHAALAEVPEEHREVLVLFYWEQQSIAQVAATLGITEEAAQKRISRARGLLRAELAPPLERQGRKRRPAAAAAAAVLAIIATRSGAAAAATGGKGTSMLIKVGGAVCLAGMIAGVVAVARGGSSDAAPAGGGESAARESGRSGSAASKAGAILVDVPPELPKGSADQPGIAIGGLAPPAKAGAYELTVLAPTSVAVNLEGGVSPTYLWEQPAAPTFERKVRGRVTDDTGAPIAGAVVVVGSRLDAHMGSLFGEQGAVSAADGTFVVASHEEVASSAVALHARGWSAVASVPAGRADATVNLRVPRPGALALRVTQGAAGREAEVSITPAGGGLRLGLKTDASGELRVPLLPPGGYKISVQSAQMFAGGTSPPLVRDVTVKSGAPTEVALELKTGVLVIASAFRPGLWTVEYFFYPGTEKLDQAELKKRARSGAVLNFLLGGQDADRPAQFHDVAPGTHTMCVDAATREKEQSPFVCRTIEVPADKPTLEVSFDVERK
ncbi:MAG: sigma-70 family RNA polymerase sigma factor [Deltaproteobacteria bacterium]|nr:sigma-70 family RNA polymerase sigma factor [Deltaproteobacteria bacterium]